MTARTILAALAVSAAASLAAGTAMAQDAVPAAGASTLGGLQLEPGAEDLPLSAVSPPPLVFSAEPLESGALPLGLGGQAPTLPDSTAAAPLGTRLSLGQPLGLHALGGEVDWRAAATVEPGPLGEAYGLSLSIGSLSEAGPLPPSDLRMGLTYGTSPATGEQGVVLDFSYRF